MTESQIRQNFSAEVEAAINKQVNVELYASYVYLSMASYFDRDDVALHNIAEFFKKQSNEERDHALGFMKYQHTRGGRVIMQDIKKPEKDEWGSALEAFESALKLEKLNNQSLLDLHAVSSSANDPAMCDFIESEYLQEQVKSIEEIGKIVTNLKRVGKGLGEYIFDKENFS